VAAPTKKINTPRRYPASSSRPTAETERYIAILSGG
jgi:hypothetical protein